MKELLVLFAGLFALTFTASADTFTFSYSVTVAPADIPDTGSGTLTATYDSVANDYDVTSISGTTSAFGAITGLIGTNGYENNDNLLFYPSSTYVDENGISFTVTGAGDTGSHQVNLFSFDGAYYEYQGDPTHPGTLTITPATSVVTPEPSSAALLLFGLAGTGIAFRRVRRVEAAKQALTRVTRI